MKTNAAVSVVWLFIKVAVFLLLTMQMTEIIVVAYQRF